ncbi:major facilitator superfamily MFS_1 [Magnetococcus marinus MC-1]|uniref:Major facilitator superfamily MFS_1 n=1 Tax=Magnetococcus marinus (strain ATCC BAA-1437 / JCM 17883 / MC-1) TaxID=156889 RepID=A0LD21_MAGMM|nr:MFS transporter [Magnetococcus marinus]ABK45864.1 major facilitator superfamily MFS_1 [Magnetococcus marinus MC-1]
MKRKSTISIIFFTVFLDLLGFGLVLPLLPNYASDPMFHASTMEIGVLMGIYSLMQFLFAPLWGRLSDHIGRRPVLIIGLFGSALSYLIYGLAESLMVLILSRALAGFMGANIAAAQAAMADLTPPEKRAQAMGIIGAAFSLGFVLGPAMGGYLASTYGISAAPLAAALITGLNAVAALFLLSETRDLSTEQQQPLSKRAHPLSLHPWKQARNYPGALMVCLFMGLFITLFAAFEMALPLWTQIIMGWDSGSQTMAENGHLFAFVGVVMAIVQGGIVRRLVPKIGEVRTAYSGLICIALGLMLLGQASNYTTLLIALGLAATGAGLVHPAFSSLVSLNTDKDKQGLMMGLFQSMGALGRVLGPLWAGIAFVSLKGNLFFVSAMGMTVLLGALIPLSRDRIKDARQIAAQDAKS